MPKTDTEVSVLFRSKSAIDAQRFFHTRGENPQRFAAGIMRVL